ncbi:MAG: radical SAM protein, partial [Spirochaetaceae bacterium]|nr:radical SAM protein [Spirochaetaceae bacterium]
MPPPEAHKAAFLTLGCKLNQSETEGIADAFRRAGFTIESAPKDADIIIVNTCAVTAKAEQKARRLIRSLLKSHAQARIIVTGCYTFYCGRVHSGNGVQGHVSACGNDCGGVSNDNGECERLFVVSGDDKPALLDLPEKLLTGAPLAEILSRITGAAGGGGGTAEFARAAEATGARSEGSKKFRFNPEKNSFHSRAQLKIQDGCDNACAYCAVTLARGPSLSIPAEEALIRLKTLEDAGAGEAVLTGVNIGLYHSPQCGGLAGLLAYLLAGTKLIALRLSSLEAAVFSDEFFELLHNPRIRPHFHLSLQSLSETILKAMGRNYHAEQIFRIIERLREVKRDPFLACDIITGFPGETQAEFEKTKTFCEQADFAWIHAFPFSARPGTAAFTLPGKTSAREASSRAQTLTSLAKAGRRRYTERSIGRKVSAIFEGGSEGGGGQQIQNCKSVG